MFSILRFSGNFHFFRNFRGYARIRNFTTLFSSWNEQEIESIAQILGKRLCSENDLAPPPSPVPTLPAAAECYEDDHQSWGRPVCCAQADVFIGLQAVGDASLSAQLDAVHSILDGFVTDGDHLLVSFGLLYDSENLMTEYQNSIPYRRRFLVHSAFLYTI